MTPVTHHPFAYDLGPLQITGFGLGMLLAFVIGQMVATEELDRRGQESGIMADVTVGAVIGGLLGAKLYYAILTGDPGAILSRAGFVFWGGLHGLFLIVNHLWLRWRKKTGRAPLPRPLGMAITFVCVLVTWVFFRAGSFSEAWTLLGSMIGLGGGGSPFPIKFWTVVLMVAGLTMVFRGPNTMQIMRHTRPAIDPVDGDEVPPRLTWALEPRWAYVCGALLAACVIRLNQPSPFIYFQF